MAQQFLPIPKDVTDRLHHAESRYRVSKTKDFLSLHREYRNAAGTWTGALDPPIRIPLFAAKELIEFLTRSLPQPKGRA